MAASSSANSEQYHPRTLSQVNVKQGQGWPKMAQRQGYDYAAGFAIRQTCLFRRCLGKSCEVPRPMPWRWPTTEMFRERERERDTSETAHHGGHTTLLEPRPTTSLGSHPRRTFAQTEATSQKHTTARTAIAAWTWLPTYHEILTSAAKLRCGDAACLCRAPLLSHDLAPAPSL